MFGRKRTTYNSQMPKSSEDFIRKAEEVLKNEKTLAPYPYFDYVPEFLVKRFLNSIGASLVKESNGYSILLDGKTAGKPFNDSTGMTEELKKLCDVYLKPIVANYSPFEVTYKMLIYDYLVNFGKKGIVKEYQQRFEQPKPFFLYEMADLFVNCSNDIDLEYLNDLCNGEKGRAMSLTMYNMSVDKHIDIVYDLEVASIKKVISELCSANYLDELGIHDFDDFITKGYDLEIEVSNIENVWCTKAEIEVVNNNNGTRIPISNDMIEKNPVLKEIRDYSISQAKEDISTDDIRNNIVKAYNMSKYNEIYDVSR